MSRSHHPPHHGAEGGLKLQVICFRPILSKKPGSIAFNKLLAPTKLVPLSQNKFDGRPMEQQNFSREHIKSSVDNKSTTSNDTV